MASLLKQDRYYCQFLHHGKRHCFPLGKVELDEAEAKIGQVDYLLLRIKQGLLQIPPGMNIIGFLRFDGKAPEEVPATKQAFRLLCLSRIWKNAPFGLA